MEPSSTDDRLIKRCNLLKLAVTTAPGLKALEVWYPKFRKEMS
ncbi:MAG: hypothetical protein ABI443_11550 [Chthoniobacterales bacterium]